MGHAIDLRWLPGLEPESILPAQWTWGTTRGPSFSREGRLLLSVLIQALEDLSGAIRRRYPGLRLGTHPVQLWMARRDLDLVTSYEIICDVCDLDATGLREACRVAVRKRDRQLLEAIIETVEMQWRDIDLPVGRFDAALHAGRSRATNNRNGNGKAVEKHEEVSASVPALRRPGAFDQPEGTLAAEARLPKGSRSVRGVLPGGDGPGEKKVV